MEYTHVMLDLETMGRKSNSALVSIGAVEFDLITGETGREFYKVIDAFTAFQEISMFIGGVLGIGEKEIVEIEDKYKIGQHGFDKWSFRKEPSKKKRNG